MKRAIATIMVVLMVIAVLPVRALAQSVSSTNYGNKTQQADVTQKQQSAKDVQAKGTYENLKYEISNDEVTITGHTTGLNAKLVIPEAIEGYPVTTIGEGAFGYCIELTSVEMSQVKTIGTSAFNGCFALTSVKMPQVKTIGYCAFYGCNALTSVEMPQVTTIEESAFYNCVALTSVEIPQLEMIYKGAFTGCLYLTEFIIPSSNENYSVEGGALYNKDKTTLVSYPSAKGDIKLADSVTLIDACVFDRCEAIKSIDMPQVTVIGESAFRSCDFLTSVNMPQVKIIGDFAFFMCGFLTNVEMSQVESIGYNAFEYCSALTSVKMPQVTIISYNVFNYCDSLTSVEMPQVKRIYDGAFQSCKALTNVSMPQVKAIGNMAFFGCESLTSAYFYSDAPAEFGSEVFDGCAENFTIYYVEGAKGFTTPTWNGYPTQPFVDAEYTVTFVDGLTGEIITTATVNHGEDAQLPEAPEHEGYTFTGWDSDGTNITADTTITAQYEVNTYTVSYYVDGELYKEETYNYGAEVTAVAEPEKDGYTFSGWSEIPESMPANDVRVDGTFTINTHTVTFVDGLTGETITTATVNHGEDAQLPEAPEHEGYTFTGWDSDGTNITEDTTITAQYAENEQITHTVTFVDGLTGETITTATVNHGEDAQMPEAPEHEGYTFTGWDSDGTNITEDTTITAQYAENEQITHTVTFVDGLTGETITTATVNHGEDAQLPEAPEHEGYTFTGWDSDGTNITADTTITAQYVEAEPEFILGDVNSDGAVNTGDAVLILKYAVSLVELDETQQKAADVVADETINTGDAVAILKYAAGLIDEF